MEKTISQQAAAESRKHIQVLGIVAEAVHIYGQALIAVGSSPDAPILRLASGIILDALGQMAASNAQIDDAEAMFSSEFLVTHFKRKLVQHDERKSGIISAL